MKTYKAAFERERLLNFHIELVEIGLSKYDVNNLLKTLICFNAPLTGFYTSVNSGSYESTGYLCCKN